MNVLLIIRSEIICLVILLFLIVYSSAYCQKEDKNCFLRICFWALGHVVFDAVTVYTVNHLDIVPDIVNLICHIIFYAFVILFCYEYFCYVARITLPPSSVGTVTKIALAAPILYFIVTPFLRMDYLVGNGTNYSFGPCVFAGYGTAAVLCIGSAALIVFNYKKIDWNIRIALIPVSLFLVTAILVQIAVPELLFTGAGATLVTVGMYFAVENPAEKYREQAFMDLDTSVRNKNCYDKDMKYLNDRFCLSSPGKPMACVVADLNDLKAINDQYGHLTGDEIIRLAAHIMTENLKSAYGVYRIGGDEFVAVYVDTEVVMMEMEVAAVKKACQVASERKNSSFSLSIGCAVSMRGQSVYDLIREADRKMYEEKSRIKQGK